MRRVLMGLIIVAGIYDLCLLPRFPVGQYIDDARYVLAARRCSPGTT